MDQTVYDRVLNAGDAALLIGFPRTEDQWWDASLNRESFASCCDTPQQYLELLEVERLNEQLDHLVARSHLTLDWPFKRSDLKRRSRQRSLLLVVSHLTLADRVETGDGFLDPTELWAAFDQDWNGVVEVAGCYSDALRDAYEVRFGRNSLPALNKNKVLTADFWLPFYSQVYLPALSRTGLSFGQFSITMIAAAIQAITAWEQRHSVRTRSQR